MVPAASMLAPNGPIFWPGAVIRAAVHRLAADQPLGGTPGEHADAAGRGQIQHHRARHGRRRGLQQRPPQAGRGVIADQYACATEEGRDREVDPLASADAVRDRPAPQIGVTARDPIDALLERHRVGRRRYAHDRSDRRAQLDREAARPCSPTSENGSDAATAARRSVPRALDSSRTAAPAVIGSAARRTSQRLRAGCTDVLHEIRSDRRPRRCHDRDDLTSTRRHGAAQCSFSRGRIT